MLKKHYLDWRLGLGIVGAFAVSTLGQGAIAQSNIQPDDTLGSESSIISSIDANRDRIDGGATRGANLFHSFLEFNVDANQGVYFVAPNSGIENILSRITGGNPSEILGTLGARLDLGGTLVPSTANLFLINPNGIIFGPDASLDLAGSFVATTANAIRFGDRGFFNASDPATPSLLLTVDPSAFLFNQIAIQAANSIESRGSLTVPEGHSLLLVGGNVSPTATATGRIVIGDSVIQDQRLRVPGGRIEIGGLVEPGAIRLTVSGNNLSLNFPDDVTRADVSIINRAEIDVTAGGGGDIVIYARNLDIRDGSDICAGIGSTSTCGGLATDFGSVGSQAGDITLDAQEMITITDPVSLVENSVNVNATGNAGNIKIQADSLFLTNGGQISTDTSAGWRK